MKSAAIESPPFTLHGRHFTVGTIKPGRDQAEVYEFMQKQFRCHEPITNAIKSSAADTADFYRDICEDCFKHDFSLIARDNQGQLAGITLSALWPADESGGHKQEENGTGYSSVVKDFTKDIRNGPYKSQNANRLAIFLEHVELGLASFLPPTIHQHNQNVLKLDILAVHPMFLRLGLASHLLQRTIEIARLAHCTHIVTTATAMASQNLFRKFGFQTVRRIDFNDFLEDGIPVYKNLHDNGTGAELMILKL